MGAKRVTMQSLWIIKIDRRRNLVDVKGPVPGQKGEFVEIQDAVKKPHFGTEKAEGKVLSPPLSTYEYADGLDGSGTEGHEVVMPQQEIARFDFS